MARKQRAQQWAEHRRQRDEDERRQRPCAPTVHYLGQFRSVFERPSPPQTSLLPSDLGAKFLPELPVGRLGIFFADPQANAVELLPVTHRPECI